MNIQKVHVHESWVRIPFSLKFPCGLKTNDKTFQYFTPSSQATYFLPRFLYSSRLVVATSSNFDSKLQATPESFLTLSLFRASVNYIPPLETLEMEHHPDSIRNDTDSKTMTRLVMINTRDSDFVILCNAIQTACKLISRSVRKAGIANLCKLFLSIV